MSAEHLILMFCFFSSRRRHTRCALVTGVQTCALPISRHCIENVAPSQPKETIARAKPEFAPACPVHLHWLSWCLHSPLIGEQATFPSPDDRLAAAEIGRASCRERVCPYV